MFYFIRKNSSSYNSDVCSICLDPLGRRYVYHQNEGEKHPVHEDCILQFFQRCQQNSRCPTCKKPIYARILDSINTSNVVNAPIASVREATSQLSIRSQLSELANRGDISSLAMLLSQNQEARDRVGQVLIIAVTRQNLDLIRYILENYYVQYETIQFSYETASAIGNLEIEGYIQYHLEMRDRYDSQNQHILGLLFITLLFYCRQLGR